jgi:hypothetical protein
MSNGGYLPENKGRSMILIVLQTTAIMAAATYLHQWRAGIRRRNKQTWGSLLARLRPDWNSRELNDPSLWAQALKATPEEKWNRIEGARGLVAMYQNASVMLDMADYAVRNSDAVDLDLIASLRSDAMQIRVSVMVALARYAFCQVNESICVNALRAASMYAGMTTRMTELLQQNAAGMVPNFVAAM